MDVKYDASCANGALVNNFSERKRSVATYRLGRKTELSTTDGGTYWYEYDKSSNVISTSNSRLLNEGRRINFVYDSLNRLTEKNYEDKNGAPVVTKFHYGKPDSGNSSGRLVRTEDETGTVEVEYGSLGEIKKEVRVMKQHDVNGKDIEAVMEYAANYLGQMEKMKYPDGEEITYVYDDAGQICSVLGSNGDYVDDIGYDECGQRVYIKYSNGVSTEYNYKKETRLLDVIKTKKDSKFYQNIKYDFTKAGNIKQYTNDCLSDSNGGNYRTTQSYEYDGLYQLTKASGTTELNRHGFTHPEVLSKYEQNFLFDKLGNMKTKKSSEVTVTGSKKGDDLNYEFDYEIEESHAHRYSRIGKRYYKYDEVGNIICEQDVPFTEDYVAYTKVEKLKDKVWGMDEGWGYFSDAGNSESSGGVSRKKINRRTYEWNAENQMTQTSDESLTVNYTYGADGKRASKYTHSSETLYFNDYWVWHIDSAVRSRGGKVTKNIYLGTERIASRIGSYNTYDGEERENTFFYHPDHLGSAQLVTDYKGDEYQRLEYTPYGETWMDLKAETSLILKLPYKFSSKELDEETGLYYYGARYLDPKYSRWISADPAMSYYVEGKSNGSSGGIYNPINLNLYHYAGNNPVRYSDPTGLFDWDTNTIQEGDTLSQIAKDCNTRYGTNYTADDLQGLNSDTISDKDKIYAGNHLNLGKAEDVQKRAADYTNRATTQYSNEQVTPPSQKSNDVAFSFGFGGKLALVLGLGAEGGVILDTSGNIYAYLSGSVGCGIQTPSTTKTDLSTLQYLKKSVGPTGGFSLDPTQVGTSSSLTADICLGVTGTYDLNNQKSSGLPNSWGFGSVGGGVWKTGTVVLPVYRKKR